MQYDSYSCGIWAIWIHEKWMQYWMLENTYINFEEWFTQQIQDIPSATSLREYYHEQMQTAMKTGQDGRSGFRRTHDISAERMASRRNAQELTRQQTERIMQGEGARHRPIKDQCFHHRRTTSFDESLHRTNDMSHKPNSSSRQSRRKYAEHISTNDSKTTTRQQTPSAMLMRSWLHNATRASKQAVQTLPPVGKDTSQSIYKEHTADQNCTSPTPTAAMADSQHTNKPASRPAKIADMLKSMARKKPIEQQNDNSLPQKGATQPDGPPAPAPKGNMQHTAANSTQRDKLAATCTRNTARHRLSKRPKVSAPTECAMQGVAFVAYATYTEHPASS